MAETIKGFQTTSGIKYYDYNSLSGKPDLSIYLEESEVSATPIANKILRLNENAALPANITGKAAQVEWSGIIEKPTTLEGFGLSEEVYLKGEVYSKEEVYSRDETYSKEEVYNKEETYSKEESYNKNEVDEIIKNIETTGTDFSQALISHNNSESAHEYIQNQIIQLSNRFSTLFDSTDEELDQISELVTFIKENRSLIEAIKIPTKLSELEQDSTHRLVSDEEKEKWNQPIIEVDTTLTQAGKAADAASVGGALEQKQPKGDYAFKNEIPTKLAQLEADSENLRVSQAEKDSWNAPKITIDKTLNDSDTAADAKVVGDKINEITPVFQNEAPTSQLTLWVDIDDNSNDGSLIDETLTQSGMAADARITGDSIRKKVDKIDGKTLSSNDFTNEEKTKLSNIEDEANKTIVDAELANSDNAISNRAVNSAITNLIAQKQNKINTELLLLMPPSWVDNTYTATVPGINENTTVIISPGPKTFKEYNECGVYCSGQGENALIFSCDAVSENSLYVNVLYFE